jgi:hypothetical protein
MSSSSGALTIFFLKEKEGEAFSLKKKLEGLDKNSLLGICACKSSLHLPQDRGSIPIDYKRGAARPKA